MTTTVPIPDLDIVSLEPSEITYDTLTPAWGIYQLKRGHRFSADDIFTADLASKLQPNAMKCLDLGAGIGTVGLLSLWTLKGDAHLTMIEAQLVSHQLAKRTIHKNTLNERVRAILGDLRSNDIVPDPGTYDLVTGSPPYIPLGKGVVSPHPQRAACRMEMRGSVIDYVKAAKSALSPKGLLSICFAFGDKRCREALQKSGLHVICEQNIVFRHDLKPTITIFAATKETTRPVVNVSDIIVRDENGQFTTQYLEIRKRMGQPS